MAGGFIFDSLYFGRIDDLWNTQLVFAAYAATCLVAIPLHHSIEVRGEKTGRRPRSRVLLPLATQFALGGFWSGFIVFYGRSAALAASWPYLLVLVAIFFGNELLKKYHERLVFTSVLFFFALYSWAIFALPIYTHRIDTLTFLESGALAVLAFGLFTALLRALGRERSGADVFRIRAGALGVLVLMNLFYFTNILPPLPLAAKAGGVYHGVNPERGNYTAAVEPGQDSFVARYLGAAPVLHIAPGDSIYAYSSIFAPSALGAIIVHRWQWYDGGKGAWTTRFALTYPIQGGRDGGYRGYSAIVPKVAGRWRVSVETADGRVIARFPFILAFASSTPQTTTVPLR